MRAIGLVMMMALAGCAIGTAGGGRGLPEVTMKRATGDFVPPARAYVGVAVRSFEPVGDEWQEVAGASCQVSAGAYRAALVTPSRLILPDLGPDAPPIVADCTRGATRGRDVVGPAYPWPADVKPDAFQRITYAGWWRGYQKSGPMRYPDLAVGLR